MCGISIINRKRKPMTDEALIKETEFRLHIAVLKHVNSAFIGAQNPGLKIFHVANESRDAQQGYWNKIQGVEPGVSDFLCCWRGHMGALELKTSTGKLSNAQNKFLSWGRSIGWHTGVARSVQQAHWLLVQWGLKAAHNTIIEADQRTDAGKFKDAYDFYVPLPHGE